DRAVQIHTARNGRLRYFNHRLLTVSGLAAALLVGGVYWMVSSPQSGPPNTVATKYEVTLNGRPDLTPSRRSTVGTSAADAAAPRGVNTLQLAEPGKPDASAAPAPTQDDETRFGGAAAKEAPVIPVPI